MMSENVIIQHKGFFDYSLLNKLLMDFIKYINKNDVSSYFLKKIQIVMVEMLENNYQYTHLIEDELSNKKREPEFKLLEIDGGFKILASNPIFREDADKLKLKIDNINNLNNKELKELYKETLKKGMHVKKSNAGTGLIRIAKVTKNKINYSFKEIDNKLLYYTLEIFVNPK